MGRSHLVFAIALVTLTVVSRAIPIGPVVGRPILLLILLVFALAISGFTFVSYRRELKKHGKPSRAFPAIIAFIMFVFLAQLAMRASQV
jgi:hypothetical protein